MASAITWFQIPATDSARAKAFYETICGFEPPASGRRPRHADVGVPVRLAAGRGRRRHRDRRGGRAQRDRHGRLLNANPDLQVILDRVEGAGGKILMPKTAIGMEDAGHFAMIADTEGNTVGLHSEA